VGSSLDPNTSPDGIWYATREDVQRALDSKTTARNTLQIARALEDASRGAEDLCHRMFFPVQATRFFDWPPRAGMTPWILRLNDQELISVTALSSGGTVIPSTSYNLEPVNYGPPFSRVEIKLTSNAAFGGGNTYQRDIQISGVWGYRNTESSGGTLAAAVSTSTATTVTVDGPASAAVGVGSILRLDSERMIVTGRTQITTGQTLGAPGLTAQANSVTVAVTTGASFAVDEVLLIDAEKLLITDIAGNSLIVRRGWDGTVLAAHTAGATIYAPRTLTVTRGVLGTTADVHANASPVYRWEPPGPVKQLVIAEAINSLTTESSGYSKTARAGSTGSSERTRDQGALQDRRDATYNACGRKARTRAV
jgi:hypothetical protein